MPELERMKQVDNLRNTWGTEDNDFTPWLADENLDLLAEVLGIELDRQSQQVNVGRYTADIVASAEDGSKDGAKVVIENQLEEADHDHIGKAITYAAGLRAATVVWIAKHFNEDHRAAIDWLNEVTRDSVRFFALEIELWKIGGCGPAPKFNVVSKPNDWASEVRNAGEGKPMSEAQRAHLRFWTKFVEHVVQSDSPLRPPSPSHRQQMLFTVGKSLTDLRASRLRETLRVALYMRGSSNRKMFNALRAEKDAIEGNINSGLEWEQTNATSSISITHQSDPSSEDDWPNQIEWFESTLRNFDEAFRKRVLAVKLDN